VPRPKVTSGRARSADLSVMSVFQLDISGDA
jgi:hypothetical protein